MDGGCEINLRIRKNKMSRKLSEIRNSGSFYLFCGKIILSCLFLSFIRYTY